MATPLLPPAPGPAPVMAQCHSQKRRALNVEDDRKAVQRLHDQIREEAQREREAAARAFAEAQKPRAAAVPAFDKDMLAALAAKAREMQRDDSPPPNAIEDAPSAPPVWQDLPLLPAEVQATAPPLIKTVPPASMLVAGGAAAFGQSQSDNAALAAADKRASSTAIGAAAAAMLLKAQAAAKEAQDAAAVAAEVAKETKVDRPLKGGPNATGPTRKAIKKTSAEAGAAKTADGSLAAAVAARLPMAVGFAMPFRPTLKEAAPAATSTSTPQPPPTAASGEPREDDERRARSPKAEERRPDDNDRSRRREPRRRRSCSADSRGRRSRPSAGSDSRSRRRRSRSRSGERRKRRSRSQRRR